MHHSLDILVLLDGLTDIFDGLPASSTPSQTFSTPTPTTARPQTP